MENGAGRVTLHILKSWAGEIESSCVGTGSISSSAAPEGEAKTTIISVKEKAGAVWAN